MPVASIRCFKMAGRHVLLHMGHFLGSVLIIHFLYSILPINVTNHIFMFSHFLICICFTQMTLGISKKIFFSERLRPNRKAVLITGCARGIGNAVAKHLYSKGYHVFASCRDPNSPGAQSLKRNCCSRLQVFQLDAASDESVQKAVEFVKSNLGTSELWAIINNAGIQKGFLLELTSIEDFKDTMEVNALGPVRVTKAFLPLLRHSRGRVINVASLGGRVGVPMNGPYTMSKFACVGFSEYLRYELDFWDVKVISIEPEFFETDMTSGKSIRENFDTILAKADEEVKREYGEEFFKAFKYMSRAVFPSSNMQKIVETFDAAVSLKHPDAVYKVYRNFFVGLFFTAWCALNAEFLIYSFRIFNIIFGFPKFRYVKKSL